MSSIGFQFCFRDRIFVLHNSLRFIVFLLNCFAGSCSFLNGFLFKNFFQVGDTGFSIGAAKKSKMLSLVIGPGAGYNLVSLAAVMVAYNLDCWKYFSQFVKIIVNLLF